MAKLMIVFGAAGFAVGVAFLVMFLANDRSTTPAATADDVRVSIEGTPGLAFFGHLGNLAGQRSVEGVVPQTFTIEGKDSGGIFVATFQKRAAEGELIATLHCPREPKKQSTTATFGAITLSCSS